MPVVCEAMRGTRAVTDDDPTFLFRLAWSPRRERACRAFRAFRVHPSTFYG